MGPYTTRDRAWSDLQRVDAHAFAAAICAELHDPSGRAISLLDAIVRYWTGPMSADRSRPPRAFATPLTLALKEHCASAILELGAGKRIPGDMDSAYRRIYFVSLAPLMAASLDATYRETKHLLDEVAKDLAYDSRDEAYGILQVYFRE